jgi:hypothetical protein
MATTNTDVEAMSAESIEYSHAPSDVLSRACIPRGGNSVDLNTVLKFPDIVDVGSRMRFTTFPTFIRSASSLLLLPRVASRNSKGRLNLYVQSAYVQDGIPQVRPRPRKPIRFSVIAHNVAVGKAIRVPK